MRYLTGLLFLGVLTVAGSAYAESPSLAAISAIEATLQLEDVRGQNGVTMSGQQQRTAMCGKFEDKSECLKDVAGIDALWTQLVQSVASARKIAEAGLPIQQNVFEDIAKQTEAYKRVRDAWVINVVKALATPQQESSSPGYNKI